MERVLEKRVVDGFLCAIMLNDFQGRQPNDLGRGNRLRRPIPVRSPKILCRFGVIGLIRGSVRGCNRSRVAIEYLLMRRDR